MILFLGKEKYEGSMQSQKYSRRSIWGLSLSKMLLHFRLDLRPWFLGNGLLVKSMWYFQNLLYGFRIFATVNWKNVSVSYTTYLKPLSLIQKRSPNTSSQEPYQRSLFIFLKHMANPEFLMFSRGYRRVSWLHMGP